MTVRIFIAGAALLAAGPVSAHHSFAAFDQTRQVTLDATVKEFQWKNPHSFIVVTAPNAKGVAEEWAIEAASPAVLTGLGWRPGSVKPADKVKIVLHPLKSGQPGGEVVSVTLPSGRTLLHR